MPKFVVQMSRTLRTEYTVEAADEEAAQELAEEWAYGEYDWTDDISYADVETHDVQEIDQ